MSEVPLLERAGVPRVERFAAIPILGLGGLRVDVRDPDTNRRSPTVWVRIKNIGADDLHVFFTEPAFTAGQHYIALATNEILEGPFELSPPASEATAQTNQRTSGSVWFAAAATTTDIELMVTFR